MEKDGKADAVFLPCLTADLGPQPLFTLCPCPLPGRSRSQAPCFHSARQRTPGHTQHSTPDVAGRGWGGSTLRIWDIWNSKTHFSWLHQSFSLPWEHWTVIFEGQDEILF